MDGPEQPAAADIPTHEINGVRCTTRAGIEILTGRPAHIIRVYAQHDDDFPQPVERIGRSWWYRLDDARLLEDRRRELKPAPGRRRRACS